MKDNLRNNTIEKRELKEKYILENREEIELWFKEEDKYYHHKRSPLRAYVEYTVMPALGYTGDTYWKKVWLIIRRYYKKLQKQHKWTI